MESENFKERLIEFARKQYDMGQTNFEAFTGIAPGSINKIRSGISTSSLAKIAERCPELSLRWLLLGEGEMLERRDGARGAGGNVTTIGNVSGMTGSPVTVHGGGPQGQDGTMRVIEALTDQNKALIKQIETLTGIITNLTAKG